MFVSFIIFFIIMIKSSKSKDGCYQDYIETCFKEEDDKKIDDFDMICKIFYIDIQNEIDVESMRIKFDKWKSTIIECTEKQIRIREVYGKIDFYDHELYQRILDNNDKELRCKYDILLDNWDYDLYDLKKEDLNKIKTNIIKTVLLKNEKALLITASDILKGIWTPIYYEYTNIYNQQNNAYSSFIHKNILKPDESIKLNRIKRCPPCFQEEEYKCPYEVEIVKK